MKNQQANKQPSSTKAEPQWVEEVVPLSSVIRHSPLQVRRKLDQGAVTKYRGMTEAGMQPPPIKVGRVDGKLYLVDGWHRIEAGALVTDSQPISHEEGVLALVADMTEDQMRWEAARANMSHGVPLRKSEMRGVYRAFIRAKQHHLRRGKLMSYREMGEALGMNHNTLRNWTQKDFPRLFKALGDFRRGEGKGGLPDRAPMPLDQEHTIEARKALEALTQHANALKTPEGRWELLQGLEAAVGALMRLGVREPPPAPYLWNTDF